MLGKNAACPGNGASLPSPICVMKLGSEAHKELFCRSFLDSHLTYEPATLPWPHLDNAALERLRAIPFWAEALRTERRAGKMVTAFAETIKDPLIREAIALQGQEETRHGRLIEFLIQHYGIEITEPQIDLPDDVEAAFIDFGFSECLDSYLAFGMFGLAHQAACFPEPLFEIFTPILDEEARHIVFFVNWFTYEQVQHGRRWGVLRWPSTLGYYSRALGDLMGIVRRSEAGSGQGFTATGATSFVDDLTLDGFLAATLEQNQYRMRLYDAQLLQPRFMPTLVAIALRVVRLCSGGKSTEQQSPAMN
jgi:hypothetical protein